MHGTMLMGPKASHPQADSAIGCSAHHLEDMTKRCPQVATVVPEVVTVCEKSH